MIHTLNGLDPTQLCQLKEKNIKNEFSNFPAAVTSYFEKTYNKKFKDAFANGYFYFIDNFETMNLIVTDATNIARPRGLFYYDITTSKLLPLAIQLSNKEKVHLKVTIISGKNLPKMDIVGSCDPYLEWVRSNTTLSIKRKKHQK